MMGFKFVAFEVIRRGYHRLTVTVNTKQVTMASTGNVHHQIKGFEARNDNWHCAFYDNADLL